MGYICSHMGPEQEKDCPGSVTQRHERGQGQVTARHRNTHKGPPGSDLCSVTMLRF